MTSWKLIYWTDLVLRFRSIRPAVLLVKVVLKICSKFTEEHPCRSVVLIKLQSNFIEIALRHGVLLLICCIFSEHLFLRTLLQFENYFPLKKTCKKSVTPWKVLSFPLKNVMNTSYLQSLVKGDFYNRNAIWSFFFRSFKRNSYSNKSFWRGKFIWLSICNNHNFLSNFEQMRLIDMHQRLCIS